MKRRDLAIVGLWTVATMGVSLAAFWPVTSVAGDSADSKKIAVPTLTCGQTDMTLQFAADKRVVIKDGVTSIPQQTLPAMELVAVNRGDTDAKISYAINAQGMAAADTGSRSMQILSTPMWEFSSTITVPAGKTIKIPLKPDENMVAVMASRATSSRGRTAGAPTFGSVTLSIKTPGASSDQQSTAGLFTGNNNNPGDKPTAITAINFTFAPDTSTAKAAPTSKTIIAKAATSTWNVSVAKTIGKPLPQNAVAQAK